MKARFEFASDEAYSTYLKVYFAVMAMQGLLSNSHYISGLENSMKKNTITDMNSMCVRESIDMADELIKQLES